MLINAFKAIFLLCLCSCQYQFGSTTQSLNGLYFVNKVENTTNYRLVDSQLRSALIRVIQRNKGSKIGSENNNDYTINIKINKISKIDKEVDPSTGYVSEAQFIIEADFTISGENLQEKHRVFNTNHKNSSGIYRPPVDSGDSTEEQKALDNALIDLSEAMITSLSGMW